MLCNAEFEVVYVGLLHSRNDEVQLGELRNRLTALVRVRVGPSSDRTMRTNKSADHGPHYSG